MRLKFVALLISMLMLGGYARAYDFLAVCESGQTLYYNITSNVEPYSVEVTYESSNYPYHTTYPEGDIEIPETVSYDGVVYNVTSIAYRAFEFCSGLTSLILPNSITYIGDYAFHSCTGLTSVYYTGTLAQWCDISFDGRTANPLISAHNLYIGDTLVTDLIIPSSIPEVKSYAFAEATCITSIDVSASRIGSYAFSDCSNIISITIGDSVTSIENGAFNYCRSVETLNYNAINCTVSRNFVYSGCSALTNINIGNNVMNIPSYAFYGCNISSVTIPSQITSIGAHAFDNCSRLTTVNFNATNCESMETYIWQGCSSLSTLNIGDNVTRIPDYAFYDCNRLTGTLFLPNSITSIGTHAFQYCNGLTGALILPNSITSIDSCVFLGCHGLTSVTIPNSITSINSSAFSNCSGLTSLILPNTVTYIGNSAFQNCTGLTSVYYIGTLAQWCDISFDGNTANPLIFAHNLYIGDTLVTDLIIPSSISEVKSYAFAGATCITSVDVSASIIGSYAFKNCSNITSTTIGNSVTSIEKGAFNDCSSMETLNYNAINCTFTRESVYSGCSALTNINIGNNVTNIPSYAFYGCKITSVTIPSQITNIGAYAFDNCSRLTTVNFNATNCENMANSIWHDCSSLSTLNIGDNVTRIPDYAFYNCHSLTETLLLPNSIRSIGSYAFYDCNGLTGTLLLPNTITSIGSYAFYDCSGLTGTLYIPNSITSIDYLAFAGCTGLTSIDFDAINCTTMGRVFTSCTSLSTINISENVINIPDYAFYNCKRITSIIIPSSVSRIGEGAFKGCSSLDTVYFNATSCTEMGNTNNPVFSGCDNLYTLNIGSNVTSIPANAFYNCTKLNSPQIPSSVSSIGDNAFYMVPNIVYYGMSEGSPWGALAVNGYCDDGLFYTSMEKDTLISALRTLVSVEIPNTVVCILQNAFNGCDAITSLTIGSSVKKIGGYAFSNCTSLSHVNIPDSVKVIGEYAFNRCNGLTSLTMGSSVKSIGTYAFSDCTSLSHVSIPDSVEVIGEYAFYGCTGLTSLTIGKSVNYINQYAFKYCRNLTTVNYNASACSYMGTNVFSSCYSFSTLNIGENVTRIPSYAFYECDKLTGDLIIPDSLTTLGYACFYGCTRLTSLTIGKSVTNIDSNAFNNCSGLNNIFVNSTIPPAVYSSYSFSNYSATLWVPCGYSETYASETVWDNFSDIRESRTNLLNVESSNLQKGTVKITQHPNCDDGIAVISATPKEHFRFVQWNDGNTDNPRTVAVESDTTFTATFANALYTITVISYDETMGTVSGSGTYEYGAEIQISAMPAEHYHFVSWSNSYTNTNNPYTLTVTGDATYTAYFRIDQHNVTVNTESSTEIGGTYGSGIYNYGSQVEIIAYCYQRYIFLSWNDGNTDNPRMITVESDTTFTAIFTDAQHTITVLSDDVNMGSVFGGGTYDHGSEIQISATASEGYAFLSWDDGNTDNPRTIIVESDETYIATFDVARTVTLETPNSEMGTVIGSGVYAEGAVVEITAVPNEGYIFDHWVDVDNPLRDFNTDNPRTIVVSSDVTYVAVFVDVTVIEENVATEISLFPNPVTDILNITSLETISEIEIVNISGQVVRRIEVNSDNAVCNVEDLKSGVYVVRIRTLRQAQGAALRKFVKE